MSATPRAASRRKTATAGTAHPRPTETSRRSLLFGWLGSTSVAPHAEQKRASSLVVAPQFGHFGSFVIR
jgi:hypothetical protein